MKKWISLFILLLTLTSLAQSGYNYSFTDPCTLSVKSVFVPAGSGVVVNYFDNHSTFSSTDFSSGVFDAWIAQVSQQNSSSPCSQVTTVVTLPLGAGNNSTFKYFGCVFFQNTLNIS